MGTEKRERQRQARQEKIQELRKTQQRQSYKSRGVLIGGIIALFLIGALIFSIVASGDDDNTDVATDDTSSTTGAEDPTDTSAPTTTIAEVRPGPTECPAGDGSSKRTLEFEGPFQNCLDEAVDYQARFITTEGDVVVDLREEEMPNTVNNFVALARYHYYDDTVLFRTDPSIDIIQGGSPHTQDPSDPGPGYTIPDMGGVFTADAAGNYTGPFSYGPGQLIMARSAGPDSSSAQFFFSTGPNVSHLDGQGTYLLFGEVTEGISVLQTIIGLHEADPQSQLGGAPSREVRIEQVEIVEG